MVAVSVVIITKNEADVVARSIGKAKLISPDIVVIDNGSTDGTVQIARYNNCRVYQKSWDGYAANKNKGIELAEHDWILSIDADEVPDEELIAAIHELKLDDPSVVYDIKFRSYFGNRLIRFGKWGRDHHVRLFNRTEVKWSDSPVHETLHLPEGVKRKSIKGYLHHYSVKNVADFNAKSANYAWLCAKKYYKEGRRATFIKLHISPLFSFVKNYVFGLGFLDGIPGWEVAAQTVKHTRLKYRLLYKLEQLNSKPAVNKIYIDEAPMVNYIQKLLAYKNQ